MHSGVAAIGHIVGRAQPFKISDLLAIDLWMYVSGLLGKESGGRTSGDGLREMLGRRHADQLVHIGEMLTIKLVKFWIIHGMMFRAVPPVPITTLGNHQFLEGERFVFFT